MNILDDMGVSKLSAKVFFKVNYSFKHSVKSTNVVQRCLKPHRIKSVIQI